MRPGILAIWNDCRAGGEAEFEAWFHGEHLVERVSIPGFRRGRRYAAAEGAPAYMTCYETDDPSVLRSAAYRARVDDPTPATRSVMEGVFRNMIRTVCTRTARRGAIRGGYRVTARFAAGPVPDLPEAGPGGLRAERWESAEAPGGGGAASTEERLRGGDRRIAGCLVEDFADQDAARAAAAGWRRRFGAAAEVGVYRLISTLDRADLAEEETGDDRD